MNEQMYLDLIDILGLRGVDWDGYVYLEEFDEDESGYEPGGLFD
jgi:hypothetical protein